jgi:hypothetical protein
LFKKVSILITILFGITFFVNNFISAQIIEQYYLDGFYQSIRWVYQNSIAYLPFAFVYFLIPIVLFIIFKTVNKCIKYAKSKLFSRVALLIALLPMLLYALFYILWGFNYRTRDISTRINVPNVALDTNMIYDEVIKVNEKLYEIRSRLSHDTAALSIDLRPYDLENQIRKAEANLLDKWGYKSDKIIKIRPLFPRGTLLVWSTAGIYNPFSFEGHYDAGLSHIQSTYVIAHEMGHGYGLTSEADCNFIALLTCLNTNNDYIRYTGLLTYWRYLMNDLRKNAQFSFYKAAYHRPLGVRNDIKAIYHELDKYPDLLPNLRDLIYDNYLKSNGVKEGLKSYNRVVDLFFGYRLKYGYDFMDR